MTATHTHSATQCQRKSLEFSLSPQNERKRDGLLREAWLRIVDGFECRPTPRAAWDHAADFTESRWDKLLHPMRMAVSQAVLVGNQNLIDQTMEGVRDFLRAIEADVASLIPSTEEESVVTLALLETEYSGVATVEAMRLVAHPSPIEAERAIEPLLKEESALTRLLNRCQRLAREPQMRSA